MARIWLGLFGLLILAGTAGADTTWVATGTVAGRWEAAGSPYMVMGNLRILPTDELVIGSGVTVFIAGHYAVEVRGVLTVLGTTDGRVTFTTDTSVHHSGWRGLRISAPPRLIRLQHAVLEFVNVRDEENNGLGGAIFCESAQLELSHCDIRYCQAVHGHGIYARTQSTVTLNDCRVYDNGYAAGNGGGICVRNQSNLTLRRTYLTNNLAIYGGAIWADGSSLLLEDCMLNKNTAVLWGGGVFANSSAMTANRTTFHANVSIGGGAIDGRMHTNVTLTRCLLLNNTASRQGADGPGGGLALQTGEHIISNCTFIGNTAGNGGAILAGAGTRVDNCIIAFSTGGGGINFPYPGTQLGYNLLYNNIDGDYTGTHVPVGMGVLDRVNLNGDSCDAYSNLYYSPQFSDTASEGYQLGPDSPCIDAGSPLRPRDPDGTLSDIGAFYYDQSVAADPAAALLPAASALLPAWPNPFNATTELRYTIAQSGEVALRIFDLLGRELAVLVHERQQPGSYTIPWNPATTATGSYFAVLTVNGVPSIQKLLLLK